MDNVIAAFFFMLPVILAGLVFIVVLKNKWLLFLKKPLDHGLSLGDSRLFGKNKTWLGVIMMSFGTVFFTLMLGHITKWIKPVPLYQTNATNLLTVWIIGASYVVGELPNSFIKRRLHIAPGEKAPPGTSRLLFTFIDNVDSVIVVASMILIIYNVNLATYLVMLVLGSSIHAGTDLLMKHIALK